MDKKYATWFILGAYGVWFAILSGTEEVISGKYWKIILALILGVISYLMIAKTKKS
ncbi:MAG: hypothetical protein AAB675_00070 [Patescibacteria group bacterium]